MGYAVNKSERNRLGTNIQRKLYGHYVRSIMPLPQVRATVFYTSQQTMSCQTSHTGPQNLAVIIKTVMFTKSEISLYIIPIQQE